MNSWGNLSARLRFRIPRSARAGAWSRKATRSRARSGSLAANACAAAVISKSMGNREGEQACRWRQSTPAFTGWGRCLRLGRVQLRYRLGASLGRPCGASCGNHSFKMSFSFGN